MFIGIICSLYLFVSMINGYPSNENEDKTNDYCFNQGIYLRLNNSSQCYCLPEWEGERCNSPREFHRNNLKEITRISSRNTPCTYVPDLCKNGGVCHLDDKNKLACECPYPYDGARCQEYSVCYNYCFNAGVCTVDIDSTDPKKNKPKCECNKDYFEGERCQFIITTTAGTTTTTTTTTGSTTTDVICTYLPDGYCNTGTCVVSNNRALCQCPSTHTGDQCQFTSGLTQSPGQSNPPTIPPQTNPPIIPGQTNPPIIPGQTNPPIIPGQTNPPIIPGQTNVPQVGITCLQNPCRNNRPCYNNGNSYYCYCGTFYSGIDCEISQG